MTRNAYGGRGFAATWSPFGARGAPFGAPHTNPTANGSRGACLSALACLLSAPTGARCAEGRPQSTLLFGPTSRLALAFALVLAGIFPAMAE